MPVEFEDRLGATLRRTADTFAPEDPVGLVAAGHLRGRRMRRRRTIGVTAGAAALAVVTAGGVLGGTVLRHDNHVSSVASAPTATGQETVDLLVSLLPPGTVTGRHGTGPLQGGRLNGPTATVHFTEGGRVSTITLSFVRRDPSEIRPLHCGNGGVPGACKTLSVGGGTLLLFTGEYAVGGLKGAGNGYPFVTYAKGNYSVKLSQMFVDAKGKQDYSVTPLLDQADITRIVTDERWEALARTLPRTQPPGAFITYLPSPR
jgi:hypothetical protein